MAVASGHLHSDEVSRHLDECRGCRSLARVAEPPPPSRLPDECARFDPLIARLASGPLTEDDRRSLEEHLQACLDCAELARLPATPPDDLPELLPVDPGLYVKEAEVGAGGMGRTYRVRDRRLGRIVALKEQREGRSRVRFEQEARLTAQLQHPAIVGVHEAGRWPDGSPFYTMELVEGTPLDVKIREAGSLRERLALLPAVTAVAEAVAYAHERRVVHRDI